MKKITRITKSICIILIMALVIGMFVPVTGMEAQAAKKVTTNFNRKKASSVKVGTTKITAKMKKGLFGWEGGYVKFKAPKTGTYQFIVSNCTNKSNPEEDAEGYIFFEDAKGNNIHVKTQGGKTDALCVASYRDIHEYEKKINEDTKLKSRTATLKLKKGQTIYLRFENDVNSKITYTYNLQIKKK